MKPLHSLVLSHHTCLGSLVPSHRTCVLQFSEYKPNHTTDFLSCYSQSVTLDKGLVVIRQPFVDASLGINTSIGVEGNADGLHTELAGDVVDCDLVWCVYLVVFERDKDK